MLADTPLVEWRVYNATAYQPAFAEIEEVSDEQIHRAGMQDWVMTVAQLWDAIGKPVEEVRLNLYCKQLRNVPLGLLEIGVNYAISNNTFANVPPVGKIYEGIRKELSSLNMRPGLDMEDMIELWLDHKMKSAFHRFG